MVIKGFNRKKLVKNERNCKVKDKNILDSRKMSTFNNK